MVKIKESAEVVVTETVKVATKDEIINSINGLQNQILELNPLFTPTIPSLRETKEKLLDHQSRMEKLYHSLVDEAAEKEAQEKEERETQLWKEERRLERENGVKEEEEKKKTPKEEKKVKTEKVSKSKVGGSSSNAWERFNKYSAELSVKEFSFKKLQDAKEEVPKELTKRIASLKRKIARAEGLLK